MELKDYFSILWRRKWVILITITVVLIVIAVGHFVTQPTYTATATLRVAASIGGAQNSAYYNYNEQLMNTYVELATSRPVIDALENRLGLASLPKVTAMVVPNTELIRIQTEGPDPEQAGSLWHGQRCGDARRKAAVFDCGIYSRRRPANGNAQTGGGFDEGCRR